MKNKLITKELQIQIIVSETDYIRIIIATIMEMNSHNLANLNNDSSTII